MIGAIGLAGSRKTLAWRSPDDHIKLPGTDYFCQCFGRKTGQVAQQDMIDALSMEIPSKCIERFCVRIYGGKTLESAAQHSQRESATATEKVDEGRLLIRCRQNEILNPDQSSESRLRPFPPSQVPIVFPKHPTHRAAFRIGMIRDHRCPCLPALSSNSDLRYLLERTGRG